MEMHVAMTTCGERIALSLNVKVTGDRGQLRAERADALGRPR